LEQANTTDSNLIAVHVVSAAVFIFHSKTTSTLAYPKAKEAALQYVEDIGHVASSREAAARLQQTMFTEFWHHSMQEA